MKPNDKCVRNLAGHWVRGARTAVGLTVAWALCGCGSSENPGSYIAHGGNGNGGGGGSAAHSQTDGSVTDGTFFAGSGGSGGKAGDSGKNNLPDGACNAIELKATTRVVNVLLVIDKSASMTNKPTGFATDKWQALGTALGTALDAVKNDLSFGLEFFPDSASAADSCGMPTGSDMKVPVDVGTTSVPAILTALGVAKPAGGTPTAVALQRALDYYTTGAGKTLSGDKYVLLATDGGPDCNAGLAQCLPATCTENLDGQCPAGINCCTNNVTACVDDVATTDQIKALKTAGIRTFVVGIPGSEAYKTYLDVFAVAGGETNPAAPPEYFAVTAAGGVGELTNVLTSITKQLLTTCQLHLTTPPPNRDLVYVFVDKKQITRNDPNGWKLTSTVADGGTDFTVDLQGTTCTQVETKGASSVQIIFGCPILH